jgi:hypothetical protein
MAIRPIEAIDVVVGNRRGHGTATASGRLTETGVRL